MGFRFRVSGHDGGSSDNLVPQGSIEQTTKQGRPILGSAIGRCGACGTSTPLSGRPGTTISHFTCRSCKSRVLCNSGMGFTFWSMN